MLSNAIYIKIGKAFEILINYVFILYFSFISKKKTFNPFFQSGLSSG